MNVKTQLEAATEEFKHAFAEEIEYNGEKITAIHDDGETGSRLPYQRGTADKEYFSLSAIDVSPKANDKIAYLGEIYKVIRITGKTGGFVQVETEKNNSVFPRGR